MHFRVPIAVATIALLLAASVAAQTASGTETMADVTSTTLAVTSVEAVTLQRLTVSDAVTVQSAGPGTAACTLTIENSTIGRLLVTATQFRCRVVITRCTIGSSAVTTAVEYTNIGDSSSSTVEIRSSTLTGRTAAYRIPTISGQHTIANTTLNIGHSSSSYGNAVWVSSQLTGALKLLGSAISVTGFSSSTSSGIYVGTMTGASFLLDDTTITVRNNRNTRGLHTSRATSSCLMIKNSKMDLACETSCSSTGYSGVYAVSLVGSSFTVAGSELKLSTPGGWTLYTSYVFDTAVSVRNVKVFAIPTGWSSHSAWYFYRFRDSKAFLTESRIEGHANCFRYPSSATSGTTSGSVILANNILECESSVASSSTPSYATVLAQCNTLQGGAVSQSQKVYGFGTVVGCGEKPSVLSLSEAPTDAAGELQTCSAFGSIEPFSLSSSRSVEVTKTAVYENEVFGAVTVNGATSVVLRNCTVSTLLLKLNAVTLQLLVEKSTIGNVHSNTQVLGNVTFVDTDIGNALTSQAVYFAQGTSSTSTLTVLNTNISATLTGAIVGTAYGRASFVGSRIIVRGGASLVRGIEFSSYVYGGLNITRCTIEVNATSSGGARALFLLRTRSGVHIEDSTLKANTITGTAIAMYLYYVESKGCVYVTGGSMTGYVSSTTTGTAYGLYMVRNADGVVTLAQEAYVKADGYSSSYGAYIQNMYGDSLLLMNSAELVASARGRKSTLDARALYLRYVPGANSVTLLESTTLRSAEGACLYLPTSSTSSAGLLDIRGVYLAECYRNSVYQSSTAYVRIAQNCLRLPGPVTTAAPIGYSLTTAVFPCENNKPRTTPVEVPSDTVIAAATCAAFGSIRPFRPPIVTTLSGTVTRSNEFLGALTIVNPGAVTLTNIQATSITFTSTSRRVERDRRAATTRVVIQDSTVDTGGIKLSSTFAGMDFTIERTTITATTVTSFVYLLYIQSMWGGSFTVRDSTLKGRRMFYNPSTITDAKLVFQNTSFSATQCTSCTSDTHLNFYGRLLRTKVTFDGSSIRSTLSVSTSGARTAIAFDYLDQATVTVNKMNAYLQHYAATHFVYVNNYRKSCVTIANSSVMQACAEGSTSNSACRADTSTFFYVYQQPTANSFLTLDNVQLTMYSFSAWGVYMRYLQNMDVVVNKVTAAMTVRSSSASYFLYGTSPSRSVVIIRGSSVTMNSGYVFRFSSPVTYTSLLNVRNTLSSSRTMFDSVTRLNGKHGCNTYLRSNSQNLGSSISTCSPALPAPCAASSSIYSALGISANKEYSGGASSSSSSPGSSSSGSRSSGSSSSGTGSKVWIIGPVLGGCFVIGILGFAFFQHVVINEENNNNNADNADAANNDNHEVGNEHALFEDVNEQELQNFNLGDNNVEGAQIFQEAPNDDARLNELVRNQMGGPPAAVPLGVGGGAAAAAPGLSDVGSERSEVLTAEDDVIHPLIVAQQELAAVTRGETAPPVEIPLPYAEYATKAFERCRWRSPDGRSASFQAHDLYAGILYPYALSVTAYGDTSDVPHRLGLDYAAWARAIQGESGPTVYGVCVRRVETAAEGRCLMEHAGLRGDWMCSAGTFFVFVVTPFEPERLSVQALLLDSTSPPADLSPTHRQVIAARVAAVYSKARSEGIHCALHSAAVFVDPREQTVSLKDRRLDGMPTEAAAAAELLEFVRGVNPDVPQVVGEEPQQASCGSQEETQTESPIKQQSSLVSVEVCVPPFTIRNKLSPDTSVADVVSLARAGAMAPEPSLAFLDDGSFPIKVDAECSICYCEMTSADAHMTGAECCSPARHFVCEDCINMRVSAALTDAKTDFTSLPCAMAPVCTSVWTFDDFGALVSPQNLRKWNKLSVKHAQQEAQRQAQANMEALQQQLAGGAQASAAQAELRRHVTEVRRCLRPACPHCGMPFESFTGCLAVKCGAQDNTGRQVQGCGKEFCGACMVPTPCAKRCGHRFVSPGQLHTLWQGWRREKVQQYLRANFRRGPQDQHRTDEERDRMLDLALRAVRADLVTASIHPLGDGFPNPQ